LKPLSRLVTATAAKTGSTTTAMIDGEITTIEVARDLTVASGDVLFVSRYGSQWFALARAYPSAPAGVENDSTPVVKPSVVYGTLVIPPVDTASWTGTRWRTDDDDIRQGIYGTSGNHTGAVFYGTKPLSLNGAVVLSATAQIRRLARGLAFGPQPTSMRLITETTRPAGAPTLTSSTSGPSLGVDATDSAFAIPISWVQAMADGTAGGIGFFDADGAPFVVLAGRGSWGPAFTLTVQWQRG
jgi:hypothetical protein